jgi:hypothetical protein
MIEKLLIILEMAWITAKFIGLVVNLFIWYVGFRTILNLAGYVKY